MKVTGKKLVFSLIFMTVAFAGGLLCKTKEQALACKQCFRKKHILVLISKFLMLDEYQKFFEVIPRIKNTMKEYLQEIGLSALIYEFEVRARRAVPITGFGKFPVYATILSKNEKKFIGGSGTALMLLDQPNGRSSYVFVLDNEASLDVFNPDNHHVIDDDDCLICFGPKIDAISLYSCGQSICAHCAVNLLFHRMNQCPLCRAPMTKRLDDLVDVNSLHKDIDFLLQQPDDDSTAPEKISAYCKILSVANDARVSNGATKGIFLIADEKKTVIILRF